MVSHQNKVKVVYCGPGQFYPLANSIDFPKAVGIIAASPLKMFFGYCYHLLIVIRLVGPKVLFIVYTVHVQKEKLLLGH